MLTSSEKSSEQLRVSLERAVGSGAGNYYDMRWVDGGHATGFVWLEKTFKDAILDAREQGGHVWGEAYAGK